MEQVADKEYSDLKLVERFQRGDIKAFDALFVKYQRHIYWITYSFVYNADDACDLTQEVFVKAFNALHSFKRKSSFYTWLYRISQNICIDYIRKRNHSWILNSDNDLTDSKMKMISFVNIKNVLPNKKVELEELRREIANAVARLSIKQKQAFILRHYKSLTIKEIAETMECHPGTVKAHLFHANHRLRRILAPYVEG